MLVRPGGLITSTPAASGGGFPAALKTGLVEWWQLDQASGNETGAHSGIVLTDTNTVGSTTGLARPLARDFVRSSSEHFIDTNGTLDPGGSDFSISVWIKPTALNVTDNIYINSANASNYINLYLSTYGEVILYFPLGGVIQCYAQTSAIVITADEWNHLVVTCDRDAGNAIYVNNESKALSQNQYADSQSGSIASTGYVGGNANHFDGAKEQLGFWSRALSADDVTTLNNSGAGLVYS